MCIRCAWVAFKHQSPVFATQIRYYGAERWFFTYRVCFQSGCMKNASGRLAYLLSISRRANTINLGASLGVRHVLPVTLCFVCIDGGNSQSINSPVPRRCGCTAFYIPLAPLRVLARCQIPLLLDTPRVCTAASFCLAGLQTHRHREKKMHTPAFHLFCQLLACRGAASQQTSPL